MFVYLCLGSNIGDRKKNIVTAIQLLKDIGFDVIKISSLYETSPWGNKEQPYFLNLVLKGTTKLSPEELLREIKTIEKTIGRENTGKWGPREIDIDILFYKKEIINTPSLIIPHPQLHKRAFVLIPLKEIAPRLIHPLLKQTVQQMIDNLPPHQNLWCGGGNDKGSVVLYNELK